MTKPTEIKADIIPFSDEYAARIRGWIESVDTYKQVCRGTDFPPPDSIITSWQRETIQSFILIDSGKPVAYGELWHRKDELAFELAHILVDPFKRSQGYGTKLINLLYQRAVTRDDVAKVIIKLFQENPAALNCLMKVGFEITGTTNYTTGIRLVKYA